MSDKKRWSQEAYKQVIVRAWKDKTFKKKLLSNPKAALDEIGIELPQNADVEARESKKNTLEIVIPPSPTRLLELSQEELEKEVSAGKRSFICELMCYSAWVGNSEV